MKQPEQLSMFDEELETKEQPAQNEMLKLTSEIEIPVTSILPYEVGDHVRITGASPAAPVEDQTYLQPYKNKKGSVTKVITHPKVYYEVQMKSETIVVYHHECDLIS